MRAERVVTGARGTASLLALGLLLAGVAGWFTDHGPSLADEFVYLAGAKHFARTGSLDARFYETRAILSQGHPHQDVHAPGYVIVLGAVMALLRGGYWTAVVANIASYLLSALLVRDLALRLGSPPVHGWLAGAVCLALPNYLLFNYWAMAELVLGAAFLLVLAAAVRYGETAWGAAAAGVLFGCAFLLRESVLFGLPAVLALIAPRRRPWLAFLAAASAFMLLVYAPLSANRAAGGANFWAPTSGVAFGYEAVQAGVQGNLMRMAAIAWARAERNLHELVSQGALAERGILALYTLLAGTAVWAGLRAGGRRRWGVVLLGSGWLAMVAVLFAFYIVVQWSGYRYLMVLMPAFLPWASLLGRSRHRWGLAVAAIFLAAGLTLQTFTLQVFNPFKAKRGGTVEAYLAPRLPPQVGRIVLRNGFRFGWENYPVEVIWKLPADERELAELERAIWFDYIVLSVDSRALKGRLEYALVNGDEADPPFQLYRRIR